MKKTNYLLALLLSISSLICVAQTNLNDGGFCFGKPQHIMSNSANNWFSRPYHTDFDSDGDEDIVIYNLDSLKLFIYLNNGTGTFPTTVTTPTINNIVDITIGNLIGNDVSKDIALLQNDGSILIYKNTSITTSTASIASYSILAPPTSYTVTQALSIDAKNYDNANGDDLFVTYFHQTSSTPLFGKYCGFTNDGVGGFALEPTIGNIALGNSFTYADNIKTTFGNTNSDGYLDAIFSHTFVAVEVQETNYGSVFSTTIMPTNLTSSYLPISDVQVENYDGLGYDDVGINSAGNGFAVFSSPAISSTLTPIINPTIPVAKYLWSDLNNDGKNEFIALTATSYQFYINTGTASFAQFGTVQYNINALNEIPVNFMIADFDNNGLNDIVTCGDLNASGVLSIIKNYSYSYLQMPTVSNHGGIVCSSNPVTLSVNTTTRITNPSYVWSPSSQTTPSITTTNATTHYATITYTPEAGATCSITSTPFTVTFIAGTLPSFTITPQASTVCLSSPGDEAISYTLTGTSNYTYTQVYPTNSQTITSPFDEHPNCGAHLYYIEALDPSGCKNNKDISVFVIQVPLNLSISYNNTTLCAGSPVVLTASADSTKNYLWLPGSLTNSVITVNPTLSTTYTLIASNGMCKDTVIKYLYVSPVPIINASISSTNICTNQGGAVINYTSSALGNTYQTIGGGTNSTLQSFTLTPTITTIYTVTANNPTSYSACPTHDSTFTIKVYNTPTLTTSAPSTVCASYPTTLTATSTANTYTWSTGDNTNTTLVHPILNPTSYTVSSADASGLCINTKTISIVTKPLPNVTASKDTSICSGSVASLMAYGASGYSWTPSLNVTSAGYSAMPITNTTYTVYGYDINTGCANLATVTVNVYDEQNVLAFATPSVICVGGSATLHITGGSAANSNFQNEIVSPTVNSTYPITITDVNGCQYNRTATVNVEVNCLVKTYNGFSPNGDGINDTWQIENIESFPDNKVCIYNRWGNKLFGTTQYNNGFNAWDGTSNGKQVPNGTYFYVIELNNGTNAIKGWIELTGK